MSIAADPRENHLLAALPDEELGRLLPFLELIPLLAGNLAGLTAYDTQRIKTEYVAHAQHGDSEWLARGPDLAVGTRVRITGSDGAVLVVEPVGTTLPPPAVGGEGS